MYETFEHTADIGLRIRAATLPELFAEAACGLASLIVDDLAAIRPLETRVVELAGSEPDLLLFDWLNELLYACDRDRFVGSSFEVRLDEQGLMGRAAGERLDAARHRLVHEVKAITYHGLRVELAEGGWMAEVIVDI